MSRGRVQLSAVGVQDQFLTGEPQVTYFLKNFKRHTPFALETLQSGFTSQPQFGIANDCFVPRKGDLIRNMYVKVNLSDFGYDPFATTIVGTTTSSTIKVADASGINVGAYFAGNQGGGSYSFDNDSITVTAVNNVGSEVTLSQEVNVVDGKPALFLDPVGYTDSIGHALIEHADLLIGGQTVERITGEYLELYSEIAVSDSQQEGMELLVGKTLSKTGLGPASSQGGITKNFYGAYPRIFMIPLPFYFFRNDSLSIPLSALTKQEVQVNIKFRKWEDVIVNMNTSGKTISDLTSQPQMLELTLVTEYIFLSDAELNHFRTSKIDYVISQLQLARFNMAENALTQQVALKFLNPVKELFFVIQNSEFVESNISTGNDWFNYNNLENLRAPLYEQLSNLRLDLNGETIIPSEVADAVYLRGIQPMLSHTRGPNRRFYIYSFALDPENHLPTGQVNMSRIVNQLLSITSTPNTKQRNVRVYALNYNVLRIHNGLAGVIFNDNNLN
jgi:hypothetical protein